MPSSGRPTRCPSPARRARRIPPGSGTGSPGEAVEELLVPLEQPLRPRREVLVAPDPLDLGGQRLDNEGVDAGALDPGDGLGGVGQLVGEAHGGLLGHDIMIPRVRRIVKGHSVVTPWSQTQRNSVLPDGTPASLGTRTGQS